jgi:hypothetical protein
MLLEVMLLEAAHDEPCADIMHDCSLRTSKVLRFVWFGAGFRARVSGAQDEDAAAQAQTAAEAAARMLLPHMLQLLGPSMLALAAKSGNKSGRQDTGGSERSAAAAGGASGVLEAAVVDPRLLCFAKLTEEVMLYGENASMSGAQRMHEAA